jgi:hypothetical protein
MGLYHRPEVQYLQVLLLIKWQSGAMQTWHQVFTTVIILLLTLCKRKADSGQPVFCPRNGFFFGRNKNSKIEKKILDIHHFITCQVAVRISVSL